MSEVPVAAIFRPLPWLCGVEVAVRVETQADLLTL
jgi:hypothetical protein